MSSQVFGLILAGFFALAAAAVARASGPLGADEVAVFAYLWGAELDGDVTARGASTDVEASFSDILDQLNIGIMGAAQARWGRWLVLFDGLWMELESDAETRTVPVGPIVLGPVRVDTEIQQGMADLKGGYRVLDRSLDAATPSRRLAIDLLAGARYWYLKADVDLDFAIAADREFEQSQDWVDAVGGARAVVDLSDRLLLTVYGDIGGFGIGSSSDFTWQAVTLLGWQISQRWGVRAGYRILDLDRSQGSGLSRTESDIQMRGPLVGTLFRF